MMDWVPSALEMSGKNVSSSTTSATEPALTNGRLRGPKDVTRARRTAYHGRYPCA